MDGAPDGRTCWALSRRAAGHVFDFVEAAHVLERDFNTQVQTARGPGIDDRDRAIPNSRRCETRIDEVFRRGFFRRFGVAGPGSDASENTRHFFERPLRGRETDALQPPSA